MHSTPGLSAIINVYNRADALRLVLAALSRQTFTDFEAIIADDGSGPEVRNVIAEAQRRYSYPAIHLWHEDRGWRRTVILNKAILAARSNYLVFLDGDCIPSRHYLEDHWTNKEPKRVLLGRRVEMSERWARSLSLEGVLSGKFERLGFGAFVESLKGQSKRVEDSIRVTSPLLRALLLRGVKGILGSNFSLWKEDILAINGFDEAYDTYGLEESDVQFRLSLVGVRGKSLRNLAIQYHVYHPQNSVPPEALARFEQTRQTRQARCKKGLQEP